MEGTMTKKTKIIIIAIIIVVIIILGIVCGSSWKNNIYEYDWMEESFYTLDDGTVIDLYVNDGQINKQFVKENSNDYIYCDDELILIEYNNSDFSNIHNGIFDYDDLSETVHEKMTSYYDNKGMLFNIEDELDNILVRNNYYSIEQITSSCAANDNYLFIQSKIERRYEYVRDTGYQSENEYFGINVWNIHTGEETAFSDIFKFSEDETLKLILENTDDRHMSKIGKVTEKINTIFPVEDRSELEDLMLGNFSFDDITCDYGEFAIIWKIDDINHYEILIPNEVLFPLLKDEFIPIP